LAAGYYLKRAGHDFLILEGHERVGDNWRQRWEGLRLFSPQLYNRLPGLAPPEEDDHLPTRLDLANYLEDYARHFALPVRNHCTCVSARIVSGGGTTTSQKRVWELTTDNGTFRAYNLVVASGQQLSRLLLKAGASVTLAGPEMGNLPRRFLGKDIYWWLYKTGMITLRTDRFPGKLLLNEGTGDVTVGEPELDRAIRRIKTHIARYNDGSLRCKCQKTAPKPIPWPAEGKQGVVLWCTGYRNRFPWLPAGMLDENEAPLLKDGRSSVYSEVTFLGLPNLRRPNSSLVGGVGRDAEALLEQ